MTPTFAALPDLAAVAGGVIDSWLIGLMVFAFVSSITPGPNNILLAASGARFGSRRTVAHAGGIWAGMVTLLLLAAAGFGALAATAPALVIGLQIMAAAALVWTAVGLVRTAPRGTAAESPAAGRPWSFWQGLGFQYLNPKALMMAVTAVAMTPLGAQPSPKLVAAMIAAFMIVSIPCTWVWVLTGAALRRALHSPARQRAFNLAMAALLVATIPLGFMPAMSAA
jgi:threonine/homoserine/homoserine lactone efflux protein